MIRAAGASGSDGGRDPAASPPPPIGTRTAARSGSVLGDLEPDRALAGDDPVVVVRRDDRQAALRGDLLRDGLALVAGRADDDDLGAVGRDPLALDRPARRTA